MQNQNQYTNQYSKNGDYTPEQKKNNYPHALKSPLLDRKQKIINQTNDLNFEKVDIFEIYNNSNNFLDKEEFSNNNSLKGSADDIFNDLLAQLDKKKVDEFFDQNKPMESDLNREFSRKKYTSFFHPFPQWENNNNTNGQMNVWKGDFRQKRDKL